MAFVVKDRVRMTTGTGGTGTITLGVAVLNAAKGYYRTFAAAGVANGDTVPYLIEDGASWEIGIGTYVSASTQLQRTTVLANNAGTTAAISLSGAAEVAITLIDGMIGLSAAVYRAMTSGKLITTDAVRDAMTPVSLSISGGNVAWDMALGIDFELPMTANALLLNPTNVFVGKRGTLTLTQDGTGSRTFGVGSYYKTPGGAGITLSAAAGAIDCIEFHAMASDFIRLIPSKDWK